MNIRVLLADDHRLFLEALGGLLEKQNDIEVVGTVNDGLVAVKASCEKNVDVVIMDISMPGMNGIEATRQIKAARPETNVICLSMHSDEQLVSAVLVAGASGYLLKECCQTELIEAIHVVRENRTYLTPVIAGIVVKSYTVSQSGPVSPAGSILTGREREVLQLIAEGHRTKDIASRLCLSVKTIGTHREHLMNKLGIHSVAGLTKYAIRAGMTALGSVDIYRKAMMVAAIFQVAS